MGNVSQQNIKKGNKIEIQGINGPSHSHYAAFPTKGAKVNSATAMSKAAGPMGANTQHNQN
jgi:hypothetical protein